MSWQATAWAKGVFVCPNGEKITRSEKLLLLVLADDHREHDGLAISSMTELAGNSLMSERHTRRTIRAMEAKGLIETIAGDPRAGTANCYRFTQLSTSRRAVKPTDTMSPDLGTPRPHPGDISIPPLGTLCPHPGDIAMSASSLKILRREELRAPAKNAGLVDKSEIGKPKPDFEPLVTMAAKLGGEDLHAAQKFCQWTLSMIKTLKSEPPERTAAVVRNCLDIVKQKLAAGYTITSVWGLLTKIFDEQRTKYIQGPENDAHKKTLIPASMREILKGIGNA